MPAKHIFRAYDIRGTVGKDLTEKGVEQIARAYAGRVLEGGGTAVVAARDNRESGEMFARAAVKGLVESGLTVWDAGVVPIPAFYFAVLEWKAQGGIMVTGSHLGPEYNGMKFSAGRGVLTLGGEEILGLYERVKGERFVSGAGSVEKRDIVETYMAKVKEGVTIERPLKVVLDCGNGTTSVLAEKCFKQLGVEVVAQYCESDPSYPNHHPDPAVEENLKDLQARVKEEGAVLGLAFDGDGDRLGAVDEKGNILWGDTLLALFARDVLNEKQGGKVVFEVKCSQAIVDVIQECGGVPVMWCAGHSPIKKKMKEEDAVLGGEMSGHLFFRDRWPGFDDALYAGARLCKLVAAAGKPLSELVKELPKYVSSPEWRIEVGEEEKWGIVEKARKFFSEEYAAVTVDGVRATVGDGWVLIRASNTSPKISVRAEARTEQGLEEKVALLRQKLLEFAPGVKLPF